MVCKKWSSGVIYWLVVVVSCHFHVYVVKPMCKTFGVTLKIERFVAF